MTGIEFQHVRTACGLSRKWLALHSNVPVDLLGQYESGGDSVPAVLVSSLVDIDTKLTAHASALYRAAAVLIESEPQAQPLPLEDFDSETELWAASPDLHGVPLGAYCAMLQIVRDSIREYLRATTVLVYP